VVAVGLARGAAVSEALNVNPAREAKLRIACALTPEEPRIVREIEEQAKARIVAAEKSARPMQPPEIETGQTHNSLTSSTGAGGFERFAVDYLTTVNEKSLPGQGFFG